MHISEVREVSGFGAGHTSGGLPYAKPTCPTLHTSGSSAAPLQVSFPAPARRLKPRCSRARCILLQPCISAWPAEERVQDEHGAAGAGAVPGAGGSDRGLDYSVRFLLQAAANARCCVQDLADLRAKGLDTVRHQIFPRDVPDCRCSQPGQHYRYDCRIAALQCSSRHRCSGFLCTWLFAVQPFWAACLCCPNIDYRHVG